MPLTYRGAPLAGAEAWLIGTMEHSVLGRRWVYDGCGDPVYVAALVTTILTGGTQAPMMVQVDDHEEEQALTTTVTGGGAARTPVPAVTVVNVVNVVENSSETTINAGGRRLVFRRRLAGPVDVDPALALTGLSPGQDDPVTLAYLA